MKPILRRWYRRSLKKNDLRFLEILKRIRKLAYPSWSGKNVMALTQVNGLTLRVNLCEPWQADIYFGIPFESHELSLTKCLIQPGDIVFDVGGNIGLYALTASQASGDAGKVHVFEPAKAAFKILNENIQLNQKRNIFINHVAISENPGEADLWINEESGLNSFGKTGRGNVLYTEKVSCICLDDYVTQNKISRVDFLKIDVEGFEGHVLRSAKNLLARERDLAILCELAEKNYRPLDFSISSIMDWVRSYGYEIWEIDQRKKSLKKLNAQDSFTNNNFIFIRPGSRKYPLLLQAAESR